MDTADSILLPASALRTFAADVLKHAGAPDDVARAVAEHLVESDQCGHATHGVARIPWYLQYVRDGVVRPGERPVVDTTATLPVVSANWGFSHPAMTLAMRTACERAADDGVGAVGLVRTTHVGRLGAYTELAATLGCIGVALFGGMGGPRLMAPTGSATGLLGANPISAAFPSVDGEPPLVIDFTTAATSIGQIVQAKNAGERLSGPHLVDARGIPTDDPSALDDGGAIRPFGDHKGFALAVAIEALTRVTVGAERYAEDGAGGPSFRRSGGLCLAVRADAFTSAEAFGETLSGLRSAVRAAPAMAGVDQVHAPGDRELASRLARQDAVPVNVGEWERIVSAAREVGVAPPAVEAVTSGHPAPTSSGQQRTT